MSNNTTGVAVLVTSSDIPQLVITPEKYLVLIKQKQSIAEQDFDYYGERQATILTASSIIFGLIGSSAVLIASSNETAKILIIIALVLMGTAFYLFTLCGVDVHFRFTKLKRNNREKFFEEASDYRCFLNFLMSVFVSVATAVYIVGLAYALFSPAVVNIVKAN